MRPLRRLRLRIWVLGGVIAGAALPIATAQAAVRRCGDVISISADDPTSDTFARQKALSAWIAAAGRLGPAYTSWRLAIDRTLSCAKGPKGGFQCQAIARPCGISQNPNAEPSPPQSAPLPIPSPLPESLPQPAPAPQRVPTPKGLNI
jgi:hypothetical protein